MSDFSWKLRLFLSVDLVGSTAYKANESRNETPTWAHVFREFFSDFPTAIEREAASLPSPYPQCKENLMPWKFSGDEILFWVRLHEYKEAVSHIAAFKKALVSFPERWKRKEVPLRLKATAWVAGFPVTNSEVFIETGEIRSLDFIGPSIDTGFRLTKFSSPQKFVLSADLALMFLDAMHRTEVPTGDFHLFYEGSEPLKGVLGGEPYPIVWIDMDGGILSLEERLLGVSRETKPHLLREFLAKFVDGKMIRPFIDGDDKETYGKIPAGVEQRRDRMMAMENQTKDAGEEGDIGGVDLDLPPPEMKGFLPGVV